MSTCGVRELVTGFEKVRIAQCQHKENDIQRRIGAYVDVLHSTEATRTIPTVQEVPSGCGIKIRGICAYWSCCRTVVCCHRAVYYISGEGDNGSLVLNSSKADQAPSEEDNQQTNATFFLSLYNDYTDYLPLAWKGAVAYLRRYFPDRAEYWEHWDPTSADILSPQKAKFFRGIIGDAYAIIVKSRQAAMKKQMAAATGSPVVGFYPLRPDSDDSIQSIPTQTSSGSSHLAVSADHTLAVRGSSSDSDEIVPADRQDSTERYATPLGSLTQSQEEIATREQLVQVGQLLVKFSRQKIINDLKEMTECTPTQAIEIAEEVESRLSFPCTPKDIWEELKIIVHRHNIPVKSVQDSPLLEQLVGAMEGDFYLQNLPEDLFVDLIAGKKRKKTPPLKRDPLSRQIVRPNELLAQGGSSFVRVDAV